MPPLQTTLSKLFNLRLPIIQAPMAGGISTPQLVAAVCKQGGLGSLPLGYLTPQQAQESIRETKKLTNKPFAVNIFIPTKINPKENAEKIVNMQKALATYRQKLGLKPDTKISQFSEPSADELIDIIIAEEIKILSFTFGMLTAPQMQKLKQKNIFSIGTATTVNEGSALEKSGCDAVVAQGYEAGGHRGSFLNHNSHIGTLALTRQLVTQLKIPVIAAGGIMDGNGIAAAITLGAAAAQMGTAFLLCKESGASEYHRQAVTNSTEEDSVITHLFTGKNARGIKNKFVRELQTKLSPQEIPDYPIQHYLTQEIRRKDPHYASFWAGQGLRLCQSITVENLFKRFEEEIETALRLLTKKTLTP